MQKYSGNILFSISAYIMHWVNSILTYCEQSETKEGVVFPRILFVATHKDRVVRYSFTHGTFPQIYQRGNKSVKGSK
jgi:hypothetical protein